MGKFLFFVASRNNEILGMNLYNKNFTVLVKEIEDTIRRKDFPGSRIGIISIVEMAILLKAIYRLRVSSIKIPVMFFTDLEKTS